MKRSEMVKKIAKYILNEIEQEYMIEGNENVISSELLDLIEEAGMLPPLSKSKEKELWDDIYKHNDANPVLYADCMDYYFDWEPEDERTEES
jgi:hypothetical protein